MFNIIKDHAINLRLGITYGRPPLSALSMSGNHSLFLTIGCALQPMVYLPSEFTFQFFHMFIMIPLNCAIGGAPSVAP